MRLQISHKLFMVIFASAALSILTIVSAQVVSFGFGKKNIVEQAIHSNAIGIAEKLAFVYEQDNSWQAIEGKQAIMPAVAARLRPVHPPLFRNSPRNMPERPAFLSKPESAAMQIALFDQNKNWLAGDKLNESFIVSPIETNGHLVGFLAMTHSGFNASESETHFAKLQLQNLIWVAAVIFVILILASYFLAKHMSYPIHLLAKGAQSLRQGNYDFQIENGRTDEFGDLAKSFNELARQLAYSRKVRQQWVADISHELRTPITILRAELDTLEDGLRPLTRDAITSLNTEVRSLGLLVDDLYQLAQSDEGILILSHEKVNLDNLLMECFSGFKQRLTNHGIAGEMIQNDMNCYLWADKDRLRQLFNNLFENSVRYTNSPGKLLVDTRVFEDRVMIKINDSSPSVPKHSMHLLFERLYKANRSRSRKNGASGLGLAICKSIVDAHKGQISARESDLGGIEITIVFPCYNENKQCPSY